MEEPFYILVLVFCAWMTYKNSEQTKSLYEEKDDWKLESDIAFANYMFYVYVRISVLGEFQKFFLKDCMWIRYMWKKSLGSRIIMLHSPPPPILSSQNQNLLMIQFFLLQNFPLSD